MMEGSLMIPGALALRAQYKDLTLPVVIIAGEGDRIVLSRRSEQMRDNIPSSVLQIVNGAGHMVHHLVAHLHRRADRHPRAQLLPCRPEGCHHG